MALAGTASVTEPEKTMSQDQIHVVQKLAPGGIESLAISLAGKAEGSIALVSLEGTVPELLAGWDALKPVAAHVSAFAKRPGITPGLVLELARHFRRTKPRAVVTHHIGPLLYAGLAARLAVVPVIAHVEHDAWHYQEVGRRKLGKVLMSLIRPQLVAVSANVADGVEEHTGFRPRLVTNGADIARFNPADRLAARQNLQLDPEARLIGCVGRLEMVKGFDLFIDALALMPSDIKAVVFGTGSQREALLEKAGAAGLADRIRFAGLSSQMEKVYPAFDVFCLPSRFEGLPLAALEAQACGIPVVAFETGGVSEALCPVSSILVPEGDVAALAKALGKSLSTSPPRSPRDFITSHYSFENTYRAYARLTGS